LRTQEYRTLSNDAPPAHHAGRIVVDRVSKTFDWSVVPDYNAGDD
jgi:hypothetical protein